jgi:hypothetical protein
MMEQVCLQNGCISMHAGPQQHNVLGQLTSENTYIVKANPNDDDDDHDHDHDEGGGGGGGFDDDGVDDDEKKKKED